MTLPFIHLPLDVAPALPEIVDEVFGLTSRMLWGIVIFLLAGGLIALTIVLVIRANKKNKANAPYQQPGQPPYPQGQVPPPQGQPPQNQPYSQQPYYPPTQQPVQPPYAQQPTAPYQQQPASFENPPPPAPSPEPDAPAAQENPQTPHQDSQD